MLNVATQQRGRRRRHRPRLARAVFASAAILVCQSGLPAYGANPPPSAHTPNWATSNDFGSVGLLQTRTARFRDDGELDVGAVFLDPYRRYYISFQAMPWLEGTFRYTEITNRSFSLGGLASTEDYQDRGADLKFLLWEESRFAPQIAFGLQDGIGTGLFSGEYLVASKAYYDLDFSFGMGWGYYASGSRIKNPLTTFSDVFANRTSGGNLGGEANFGDYLSGPHIGLFGGVAWRTPVKGLSLKLEASTQDYQSEPLENKFKRDLPFNLGFVYRPFPWLELSGAYERGNIAMFRASVRANVNDPGLPKTDPPPPKLVPRPARTRGAAGPAQGALKGDTSFTLAPKLGNRLVQPGDPEAVTPRARVARRGGGNTELVEALFAGFEAQAMQISSVETRSDETRIYLAAGLSGAPRRRQVRAAQLAAAALPSNSGGITLIERRADRVIHQVTLSRDEIERGAIVDYLFDSLEAKGFAIDSIDFSHSRARLIMSRMPELDRDVERAAAEIVFSAAPTPVQQVEIVQLADGGSGLERSRAIVRRADVQRAARVDQMFDGLEADGFTVESLELTKGAARVYLSATRTGDGADPQNNYEAAARLVAETAPRGVSSVEIVRLDAGVEATRVSLRRRPEAGLSAGGSKQARDEFIPDLSDNEKNELALKIFKDLEAANFTVDKFEITRRKATVFVTPTKFREHARNVGRASRVVASHAPNSVEEIEVVTMNAGLETARVSIMRQDLEAAVRRKGSPEEIWTHAAISGPQPSPPFGPGSSDNGPPEDVAVISNPRRYPTLSWDVRPALRSHIGGPDGLYLYQIWMAFSASAELYRGVLVNATFGKNVYSTLDEITLDSDSLLPHVRSDLKRYNDEGEDGNIVRLQTEYLFQPAENWFGRVSAGLFETMFGGVGGEIMYRPYGSRLALSVDVNRVQQRDYDQRLNFLDYKVTTGHLNVYYKMPFMGLLGEIHAGQFLAGDRGAQFAVVREFESGIAVGAWATFTNVSAEQFGEGSFDKGLYMRIPFEAFLATSTLRGGSLSFRPLTRDGGQLLLMQHRLYGIVEGGNVDNVMHRWDRFMD
jgi:hypothetical protein